VKPCKDCGAEYRLETDEFDCHFCNGSGRGDHGDKCEFCRGLGVERSDNLVCDCEDWEVA